MLMLNPTLISMKRRKGGEYNGKKQLHLALVVAYIVVAVELVLIAGIRHRFFGTSWWLSALQVVGGGALVFVAALIFGNA